MSWNLEISGDGVFLLNPDHTEVKYSPSLRYFTMTGLLSDMEYAGVPHSYMRGVHTLSITRLNRGDLGQYSDGHIQLSLFKSSPIPLGQVLVHELAHHLDDQEAVTASDDLIKEARLHGVSMARTTNTSAKKIDAEEYLAYGFEIFYFGDRKLLKKHPVLLKKISALHRKYSKLC